MKRLKMIGIAAALIGTAIGFVGIMLMVNTGERAGNGPLAGTGFVIALVGLLLFSVHRMAEKN